MAGDVDLAAVAQAIAEPARAAMLLVLMDAGEHTASELAAMAGVAPSTGSAHLRRLHAAGLITTTRQGRRRLHRIANPQTANAIEALAAIAPPVLPANLRAARHGDQLLIARNCYGHLGGRLAVAIARRLVDDAVVPALHAGRTATLITTDHPLLHSLGLTTSIPAPLRGCLDWSQHTHHLAGPAGRHLLAALLEHHWLTRTRTGRALRITPTGEQNLTRLAVFY
jgi:DNA-binding transcriptional ArsR family regulator